MQCWIVFMETITKESCNAELCLFLWRYNKWCHWNMCVGICSKLNLNRLLHLCCCWLTNSKFIIFFDHWPTSLVCVWSLPYPVDIYDSSLVSGQTIQSRLIQTSINMILYIIFISGATASRPGPSRPVAAVGATVRRPWSAYGQGNLVLEDAPMCHSSIPTPDMLPMAGLPTGAFPEIDPVLAGFSGMGLNPPHLAFPSEGSSIYQFQVRCSSCQFSFFIFCWMENRGFSTTLGPLYNADFVVHSGISVTTELCYDACLIHRRQWKPSLTIS